MATKTNRSSYSSNKAGKSSRSRSNANYYTRSRKAGSSSKNRYNRAENEGLLSKISHLFEGEEYTGRAKSTTSRTARPTAKKAAVTRGTAKTGRLKSSRNEGVLSGLSHLFEGEETHKARRTTRVRPKATRSTTSRSKAQSTGTAGTQSAKRTSARASASRRKIAPATPTNTKAASKATIIKKPTSARVSSGKRISEPHARAGRLGGLAPHRCRGQECRLLESQERSARRSTSKGSSSARSRSKRA